MVLSDVLQIGRQRGHNSLLHQDRVVYGVEYRDQQPVAGLMLAEGHCMFLYHF